MKYRIWQRAYAKGTVKSDCQSELCRQPLWSRAVRIFVGQLHTYAALGRGGTVMTTGSAAAHSRQSCGIRAKFLVIVFLLSAVCGTQVAADGTCSAVRSKIFDCRLQNNSANIYLTSLCRKRRILHRSPQELSMELHHAASTITMAQQHRAIEVCDCSSAA